MDYKSILEIVTEVLRACYWLTLVAINALALVFLTLLAFYVI